MVERWFAEIPPQVLAATLPYAIALSLVAAEVAWLARRPGPRRRAVLTSAAVATARGAVAVVVGFFYNVVLRFLWSAVAALEWEAAAQFWRSHPLVGAVAAFIAWDFTGWLYHVIATGRRSGGRRTAPTTRAPSTTPPWACARPGPRFMAW